MTLIRSTLFNLIFYSLTLIECLVLLPTLFLPKHYYITTIYIFVSITAFLEKYILGLDYEVRGLENLPKEGSYIVAAKHQSSYETFKLHFLFNDPAIVLKKELLKIPLWGKFLGKSDPIAINRKTPKEAIRSLTSESIRVAEQGRPIVIFPQGTRVSIHDSTQEKPYKIGIMRIQNATKLPIIPMAINTGYFYPKHKWCKKPGTVIFEFLPPHTHEEGQDIGAGLKRLEMRIEEKSAQLLEEAKSTKRPLGKRIKNYVSILLILSFILYSAAWFSAAAMIKSHAHMFIEDLNNNPLITEHNLVVPKIKGYPFALHARLDNIEITTKLESFSLKSLKAKTWPLPGSAIEANAEYLGLASRQWRDPIIIDSLSGKVILNPHGFDLKDTTIGVYGAQIGINGTLDLMSKSYPDVALDIDISKFEDVLRKLLQIKVLDDRKAGFALMGLRAASDEDGIVHTSLISQGNSLYLHGLIKVYEFPIAAQ